MELLRINQQDASRWKQIWELYEISFPLSERRMIEDHLRASEDPYFFPLSAWENGQLIGIVFYWKNESFIYLEHLAVNPKLHGKGYGSQLLRDLSDMGLPIILEIDPLIDDQSVRRLQFYERAGFSLTPYRFELIPYRKSSVLIELLILSYPSMIDTTLYNTFNSFMREYLIQYCEGYSNPIEIK